LRFVLVANNPKADLSAIGPTDAVVQFNGGAHFHRFASHPGPKVHIWRKNNDGSVSGWNQHDPARDYDGDLHVLLGYDVRIEWECERRGWPYRAIRRYPRYPRGIPTTGFWTAAILHRMGLPIALCGFTHKNVWPGHDWQWEHDWFDARDIARL
jgi:hypothetical protein